jgi:hypothetical protein
MVVKALDIVAAAPEDAFVDAFMAAVTDTKKLSFKRSEKARLRGRALGENESRKRSPRVAHATRRGGAGLGGQGFRSTRR